MFKSIRWRIVIPYVVLILTAMGALSFYLTRVVRNSTLEDVQTNLVTSARAVREGVRPVFTTGEEAGVSPDALADRWADLLGRRVTLISAEGVVLGESHAESVLMANHLRRPEVQEALVTGSGYATRQSETLGIEMAYAALPIMDAAGEVAGYVRVAVPIGEVAAEINQLRNTILTAALLTSLVAGLLAVVIAERTAGPVRRLTAVARRMAEGDLDARLYVTSNDEVGTLTRAFNHMGEQLREKVDTLAEERGRLASVLELMADGVLITDDAGRVQLINPAAADLLETTEGDALGQSFAQVVRHHQLIEVWQRCQEAGQEQAETVEIGQRDLFLQVIITPLHDGQRSSLGDGQRSSQRDGQRSSQRDGQRSSLVILQNLTPIRRLQTVRRDFISNISHELRTPLASLKAVVETLRDVALDDPEAARRFLDRADHEVDALTQMVQELLELSRIESGKAPLRLSPTSVADIVLPAAERLQPQIERNELELIVDLPSGLPRVLVDAARVQQVVTNLVHNAIKFTPAGGRITVSAKEEEGMVVVRVRDTGVGIPATDLPRIFERFYKTDRARSSGGTGLGLAIARHLVQAHGGEIWAKSKEGKGSSFYFSLPVAEQDAETGEGAGSAGG
ncbi:MAG: ATP-binding protein [Candidatus Promineifilaceae bacterium]|nr:ATP-binding protein [Candidatus Promineifilaceae bacterium]